MNRAPARLTDSAQTLSPSRSSASDQRQQHQAEVLFASLRIWNSAQLVPSSQLPASNSIVPLFGCYWCQPATWNLAWNCTADGTSFAFIIRLSRAISAEVARVPWVVVQHDAAENQKGKCKTKKGKRLKEIASNISVSHSIDTRRCQSRSEEIVFRDLVRNKRKFPDTNHVRNEHWKCKAYNVLKATLMMMTLFAECPLPTFLKATRRAQRESRMWDDWGQSRLIDNQITLSARVQLRDQPSVV